MDRKTYLICFITVCTGQLLLYSTYMSTTVTCHLCAVSVGTHWTCLNK